MGLHLKSNIDSQKSISSLVASCQKIGVSKSDPLVEGLVSEIKKTKLCAGQEYFFKNSTGQITAVFAKEGEVTRLEIENGQVFSRTMRALAAATAASTVATLGISATVTAIEIITFPSLYETACKIVPTAAKIVGVLAGLAGVSVYFTLPSRYPRFFKIESNVSDHCFNFKCLPDSYHYGRVIKHAAP